MNSVSLKGSGRCPTPSVVMRKVYLGQTRFLEEKRCPAQLKLEKFKEKRKVKDFF